MSVKLKITIFITILIILSLGVTIYYLSFEKYKPALKNEVQQRIYIQLNYINKIVSSIFNSSRVLNEDEKQALEFNLLNTVSELFKKNSELLYLAIIKKSSSHKYRTYAVYRRNIILMKKKDSDEIIKGYRIETINRFRGGIWPIKSDKKNYYIKSSINYRGNLKNEFITNEIKLNFFLSNIYVLKSSNKNLLSEYLTIKRKRMLRKEKNKIIRKININLYRNIQKYKKFKKDLKNFLKLEEKFLEHSDDVLSSLDKNKPFNIKNITRLKEYTTELTLFLDKNVNRYRNNFSGVKEVNKNLEYIERYLKKIKSIIKFLNEKKLSKIDYIKETKLFFPVGKIKEDNIYKNITLVKTYKPITYFKRVIGYFEIGVSEDAILDKIKPILNSSIKSSLYIIIFGLLLGLIIALYIIFPIKILEKGADEITKDLKYRIKLNRKDEFGKFAKTFNNLADQLTEELLKYEKLYKEATEDELTKLMVRRYFMQTLESELKNAQKEKRPTSLFMTDIDHFKKFNDTYGHQTGDLVLSHVAGVLLKNLRKNRVRNDIAGRYGGEEFCVLLPDTTKEEALKAAERIRKEVENMVVKSKDGKDLKVTISIGVATSEDSNISPEELIKRADAALYNSKETGRNKVSYG